MLAQQPRVFAMPFADARTNRDRARAAAGMAACHALLAYALIVGLRYEPGETVSEALRIFDVRQPPPPPILSVPAKTPRPEPEGAASPPSLKARPTPVVAPVPKVKLDPPPRIATVPKSTPVPDGSASKAGVAGIPGPGTGTGGLGEGIGSGGSGSGTGGGGARRAVRLRGQLANSDYPRAAERAGIEGSVSVRFTVETDGSVGGCRVTRSSGTPELDATTCRLIEQRFVYRPATDGQGRPVRESVSKTYDWLLPYRSAARRR